MTQTDHDVVVVGLGPTGLTLANLLGRRGISVLVLEREPEFYGMARAVYTDDEGMRVFQTAGAADELAADMNIDSTVQWVRGDGRVLAQFHRTDRPLGWPIANFLYQPYLENTLERALGRYPHVIVRRGREVLDFGQDADGVWVEHARCRGTEYGKTPPDTDRRTAQRVRARFLVGCDGGRSVVRAKLGIDMRGTSFPERWLVVDLKARDGVDAFGHLPYFDFVCDPQLPIVSCPQPGGHHRFEFMLTADQTKDEMEDPDTVRRHIARFVDPDQVEVLRKLVYTFNAVVADRWREGRVLIAGDAAHMTPQFIGQGMNSGVRDADNLSWKLTAILKHGADHRILDTYESERRPHAKAMIDLSVLNKNVVSLRHPLAAGARDLALTAATRLPGLGGWIRAAKFKPAPRFRRGAYLGLPRRGWRGIEGTLARQPWVRSFDGRELRFDDALGLGFSLLGYGVDPRDGLSDADMATLHAVGTRFITLYPAGGRPQGRPGIRATVPDTIDIEDHTGALTAWLAKGGVRQGGVILLRPDRFVFGAVARGRARELVAALRTQLFETGGEPGPPVMAQDAGHLGGSSSARAHPEVGVPVAGDFGMALSASTAGRSADADPGESDAVDGSGAQCNSASLEMPGAESAIKEEV
ncbi:bifunctional 3-(3-hydroxy-phenyl)propionate/3-hydroxycinnamic acid hydroxylase MhpA [Nocardia sp. CDC160]|uniref:bifunctional 3-(3-hydroxy-phenyl)propionate/3-hydroxycinnamic acid hydroxylase MhpA n=1 Tax=Nocardia sp. CDC160 TaxID=3112166 RepID=UPI002DB7695A|nr:bifunctional 3-(3-hydroxy-phenyl)propionate/3-hydroxycinnamic acid hydroxylase [Nocardia sp. CDC160]MEC3918500.1 bifunctional 3-(3-hydroxy-phenyl)propionate/3-hydroxycinnamic acid hydroxylase [Nocardia sp. CDC160]